MLTRISSKIFFIIKPIVALALLFVTAPMLSFSQKANQDINIVRDYYIENLNSHSLFVIKLDQTPDYELVNFPEKRILNIKLKQASLPKSLAKIKKFNSNVIASATLEKINPDEVWIKLQNKLSNLEYTVDSAFLARGLLVLKIYQTTPKETFYPELPEALKNMVLVREVGHEKLAFILNQPPVYNLSSNTIFDVKLTLTLKNTSLEFAPTAIESEFIKAITYQKDGSNLIVTLELFDSKISIASRALSHPHQVLLEIKRSLQSPKISIDEQLEFLESPQLNSGSNFEYNKSLFIQAEEAFRAGEYEKADQKFKQIARATKTEELGVLALFRAADSQHQIQQQQKKFDGYQKVISAYETAIDQAATLGIVNYDKARALLMIGYNYQSDRLYEEATEYYNSLIKDYPDSYYLKDALYRKAEVALTQKDYSDAVRQFQDYLVRFPYAHYVPLVHYKLGLALYNINRYADAHKNFIAGRALNHEIPSLDPDILYAEANTYYQRKAYQTFIARNKELIKHYPEDILSTIAAIDLGDYYLSEARDDEALEYYQFAIDNGPLEISYLARMRVATINAESLSDDGYQKALLEYEYIHQNSNNQEIKAEAIMRIITAHTFKEDGMAAIKAVQRYRDLYPDGKYQKNGALHAIMIENITNLVAKAYLAGRYSDVISQYVKYRRLINESENQFLLWLLANSYTKLNNYRDANQFYQILLKSNSPSRVGELQFEIGDNLLASGNYSEALIYFDQVRTDYPATLFGNYAISRIAEINIRQKNYEKALASLHQLIDQTQSNADPLYYDLIPESWFKIGEIQKELGYYEQAFEAYQESISNFPHPLKDPTIANYVPLSFFYSGDMSRLLNSQEQALRLYQRAITVYPESNQVPWALYYSALIYLDQKKYTAALAAYEQILAIDGEISPYIKKLAQTGQTEIKRNQAYARYLRGEQTP